jgi:hypothetical protein
MIVIRWTNHAKHGGTSELVKAIKSYPEYGLPKLPHGARVYSPSTLGPWDVVIWEVEFDSEAQFTAFLAEFWAAPRAREFLEPMGPFKERGGGGEMWHVEHFE